MLQVIPKGSYFACFSFFSSLPDQWFRNSLKKSDIAFIIPERIIQVSEKVLEWTDISSLKESLCIKQFSPMRGKETVKYFILRLFRVIFTTKFAWLNYHTSFLLVSDTLQIWVWGNFYFVRFHCFCTLQHHHAMNMLTKCKNTSPITCRFKVVNVFSSFQEHK